MVRSLGRLKTRVARRLLALFTLSAFLPVAAMAVISLLVVNRQLEDQSRERLRQLAKNAGMSVLQQLQTVETGLRFLAQGGPSEAWLDAALQEGTAVIRSFAVVRPDGTVAFARGRDFERPGLSDAQRAVLASGRMAVVGTVGVAGDVVTVLADQADDPGSALLWAVVEAAPIWSPAVTLTSLPTVSEFCLIGPGGSPTYCRSGGTRFAAALAGVAPDRPLGTFGWEDRDGRYIVGHWSFFPPGTAGGAPWNVLVAESSSGFRAPLADFSKSFVLVLVLGMSTVFLLANAQIRRTTDPLAALDAGTRRIASGDLSTRVEVDTPDEFGALAGSFNAMASHLNEQFTQLEAARSIDRAVLTAFNTDDVVHTILDRIPALVPCRSAGILLADRAGGPATLNWLTSVPSLGGTSLRLTTEDLAWLTAHPTYGVIDGGHPPFARAVRAGLGHGPLMVLPLVVKEKVRGALLLERATDEPLREADVRAARRLANQAAVALDDVSLVKELEEMSWGALRALARAIDAKSRWTAGHSERVTELALALGRQMGLADDEMEAIHRGGLLHDIGKIGVPAAVLDSPNVLTPAERELVVQHPTIGARILEPIRAFHTVLPIVAQHHERWDGTGYPAGLKGDGIDRLARIVAVADAYDAFVSPRPYRVATSPEAGVRAIQDGAGTQFDPEVAAAFVSRMAGQGLAPPLPQDLE
jgi:putative nucleotidyltransferase with HDIG domain